MIDNFWLSKLPALGSSSRTCRHNSRWQGWWWWWWWQRRWYQLYMLKSLSLLYSAEAFRWTLSIAGTTAKYTLSCGVKWMWSSQNVACQSHVSKRRSSIIKHSSKRQLKVPSPKRIGRLEVRAMTSHFPSWNSWNSLSFNKRFLGKRLPLCVRKKCWDMLGTVRTSHRQLCRLCSRYYVLLKIVLVMDNWP